MKQTIKIAIVIMTFFVALSFVSVKGVSGYTYDHKGQPIYSTIGLTVNQEPYVASNLGIPNASFTSPEDLFLFTDDLGNETFYIIDSNSHLLFVLDGNLTLVDTITSFKVDVTKFDEQELRAIKSAGKPVIEPDFKLSIRENMSKVALQKADAILGKVTIDYEIESGLTYDRVEWTSANSTVARVEEEGSDFVIYGDAAGVTTVTGKLFLTAESDPAEKSVSIQVTVTEEAPAPAPAPTKNHSFTLNELQDLGMFQLKLNGAVSVYRAVNQISGDDLLYICDKANNQVVIVDPVTYEAKQFVTTPDDVTFETKSFSPNTLITDRTGRMYIIADNVYEGIMQFSQAGIFNRFTGVNYVTLTPWEIFWRNFSTEAQLEKQSSIINTSFTSMAVDKAGFIYATSYATTNDEGLVTNDNAMIKKLNPSGKDILRRNGYQPPKGDVIYVRGGTEATVRGPSKFVGIGVNAYGVYTVVDGKMGKLFTYDNEGNLLYISGQPFYINREKGTQIDTLSNPVAITYHGEDVLVLDKNNKAILTYELTDIGKLINQAAQFEYVGDNTSAAAVWEQVVAQNANYEYAYIGIGKMYMKAEDYQKAMDYFQIGADRDAYSRAFKLYRDDQIKAAFPMIMLGIFALIGIYIIYRIIHRDRYKKADESGVGDE